MCSAHTHRVLFGDCDPAGIAYYPRMFGWMDAAFHGLLRPHGGHAAICRRLGAAGLGLASAKAQFARPVVEGDVVDICIDHLTWSARSLTLDYTGRVGAVAHFTGVEVRCMFLATETGMRAGAIAPLKDLLG